MKKDLFVQVFFLYLSIMKSFKKKLIFTFCFLFTTVLISFAQSNLIKNPGFELYDTCPFYSNNLYFTKDWHSLDSNDNIISSDGGICNGEYYNICADTAGSPTGWQYTVPGYGGSNANYQFPHGGNSYIGLCFRVVNLSGYNHDRDYAQSRIISSLINGKSYCFKMWVSLSNMSRFALDNIQVYFDNGIIDTVSNCGKPIVVLPQIANPVGNIITDTVNWVAITGSFTATGNEKYITIGNFYTDPQTTLVSNNPSSPNPTSAYYCLSPL